MIIIKSDLNKFACCISRFGTDLRTVAYLATVLWMLTLFCFGAIAHGNESVLDTFADAHYSPGNSKVGIEIELTGLPINRILELLIDPGVLGGKVEEKPRYLKMKEPVAGLADVVAVPGYKIRDSKAGKLLVKLEGNELTPSESFDKVLAASVTEIVSSPIEKQEMIDALQRALSVLEANGAIGTADRNAVSIQVNWEVVPEAEVKSLSPMVIVNILKTFLAPLNRQIIASELNVPSFRQRYLGNLTPGAQDKILSSSYRVISWRDLYDDLVYRQLAELLIGRKAAWSEPIDKIRPIVFSAVRSKGLPFLLPVVKWGYVRWSSILLLAVPDDPISKYLVESKWFKALPILEFREPNNDFKVVRAVRRLVSLAQVTKRDGAMVDLSSWDPSSKSFRPRSCSAIFRVIPR